MLHSGTEVRCKDFVADFNTRELPDLDYRELESYIFMHRDVSLPFLFLFSGI